MSAGRRHEIRHEVLRKELDSPIQFSLSSLFNDGLRGQTEHISRIVCRRAFSLAAHHLLRVEGLRQSGQRGVVHATTKAEHEVKGRLLPIKFKA